ncbi:MAG: DUF3320 domain-containing protein [Bacteroidota bacterium]
MNNTTQLPTLQISYLPSINFALQQNHVPVIRELKLSNNTDNDWQDIVVTITSEPEFTVAWKHTLSALNKGETYEFKSIGVQVSSKYLAELTEKIAGSFTLSVTVGNELVFKEHYKIDILAYDQWNGIALMPEMLTAFITPNHPEISNVIRKASAILEKWTGNPSFDEYQSRNPNRVRKQMAAIYEVIAEMQPIYCSVPASFEETGQRIRLTDTIFANKLANCLDISLLYAACLEAVGINPLVIIIKGHAFVGAWLIDESFADTVNDDPSLISKRTADGINEIVVVESTCMNAGQNTPFDVAVLSANQKMTDTDSFLLFIDVKRARFSGIRPLPLRIATSKGWQIEEEILPERTNVLPEDIQESAKLMYADKIDVSKQRLWERKLLDLTLRNSLLNTRMTKSAIQFMIFNVGSMEDALANGEEFQVLAKPADWDNSARDAGLYQAIHQSDPVAELVKHELSHKRIRTYLTEGELNAGLINVYRSSRLSLEENGANTLYIGLGFLKWYETEASEKPRYAPILLIPVEIIRKSAQRGFVIRSREEETVMNITLLEMLRQDFGISLGGLETLPKDESGVDVKAIFNIIRQAVMAKPRWDVEEQAILATFSFSKFILWNDIHNNADKLCKNKVVASLVSGKLEWAAEENASTEHILDAHLHPVKIALPISSDSSQLHAIVSSGQDKSFVLHGPPGTGKSQTITNIIANALYAGKKVLFVAAKKAALEVVEKRLESIGIGPFCLELHSNKSKKSAVLEQLKLATQVVQKKAPEQFSQEANRLFALRNELNEYVEALHKKYSFGYSLYELFIAYSKLSKGEDKVNFTNNTIAELSDTQLVTWQDLVEEIQTIGATIEHPHAHPLTDIEIKVYSTQVRQEAKLLIEKLIPLYKQIKEQHTKVVSVLKLADQIKYKTQEDQLLQLIHSFLNLGDAPASLLEADAFEQTLKQVIQVAAHGKKRNQLRTSLLENYQKGILTINASQLLTEWNIAATKWIIPRWLKQYSLAKNVNRLANISAKKGKQEVAEVLQNVISYQEEQEYIDKASYLPALLGFLWKNGDGDWAYIAQVCERLIEMNQSVAAIVGLSNVKEWRKQLALELTEGSKSYISHHQQALNEYQSLHQQRNDIESELTKLVNINFEKLYKTVNDWKLELLDKANAWLKAIDGLKDWYNWINVKERALKLGLEPLIRSYENGAIKSNEVIEQYQKGLYRAAAEFIIGQHPPLNTFNSHLFEDKIRKFREISKSFETLTRQELYARLAAKIPSFTQEASQSSEIGILQKAIRNNGRAMSIRKIFDLIPNLLPRLTPCMLMSPISVAQYFDADSVKFDLVIFDEASQMPTCEAVGAIARATNVIVVGDPKQMPPTNFFSNNNIDEENIEKEDLESILDDCLALSMPSQHLLWHYRSKHESLIAFSNAKYYDNKLLTFPSTDDITSKVELVEVAGYYDKGKTRQNKFEAKAIVDEVVKRLSDPVLSKRSIGIVAFSSVQQILIEDMLTDVFKLRPDIEKVALESEEPLFIKNLENVQGDERDVILFSIGYGPDQQGKVSLNFGPINRDGGWRRLNVAVSRARYEMKVFATLKADQIDLNRTGSEGVAGLKAFLAYAEKGKFVLPGKVALQNNNEQSLATIIGEEIKKRGYEVHTQIGCSTYKIDIGIVSAKDPSKYILGVLTDGKNYYNAITSKDREIVQVDVLKMLGWNIHKVWAGEWWEKPEKVINGIIDAIKRAEEGQTNADSDNLVSVSSIPLPDKEEAEVNTLALANQELLPETHSKHAENCLPYEVCYLDSVAIQSAEDILSPMHIEKLKRHVFEVLITESPISKDLLCKRILTAWGISRQGVRINRYFDQLITELKIRKTKHGNGIFLWKHDHIPDEYKIYRVPTSEDSKRDAGDLPIEEIANAVYIILKNQISLLKADLIRETAKVFGYSRLGINVENAILKGIDMAVKLGYAQLDNDRLVFIE